jgi:hypothetical protein
MKKYRLFLIAAVVGIFILGSCEKDKVYPPGIEAKGEFYDIMNQWYYWIDSIPDVDPDAYSSSEQLLEAMRFLPKDKWSYITTQESHTQYYEEGTYVGYGFSYAPDAAGNVRLTFLFKNSDLRDYGIDRGWIIKEINGTAVDATVSISSLLGEDVVGVTNEIEFESPSGEVVNQEFTKKLITMNSVGYEDIFDVGSSKVGYFVFKSFIGPSMNELDAVFADFKAEGVNELVVDLRYNGGGRLDVVEKLASYIIPDEVDEKVFVKYEHNNARSDQNENTVFQQDPNSLRLDKVYFITSKGSASASEVIINSLDPYIDVFLVGDDTYGKPVGMYSFYSSISNLVYAPVAFKLMNANDFGGYYDGLQADSYIEDDISIPFGIGEATLDEVLYHIQNGSFSSTKSSAEIYRRPVKEIITIKDELGAI